MTPILPARLTPNVLVPGWIGSFGLVTLCAPPAGVTASVLFLIFGLLVIPACMLLCSAGESPATL